ncbi:MAG: VanZ family protein [Lachnospiraceae bacterium]|nr:VanZ family protein [Lachnospiraceae bacterium]
MLIIQEILGYFFMGLIGIAGLCLLYSPAYFILRKKIPFSRQAAYLLFTACIITILSATVFDSIIFSLMDRNGILTDRHSLNLIPFQCFMEIWLMGQQKQFTQTLANILMFVPLGFIFPIAFTKAQKLWKSTLCMALFSFLIEFIQYFIGRSADIDDLMLNTFGGMLGYGVFYAFFKLFHKEHNIKQKP